MSKAEKGQPMFEAVILDEQRVAECKNNEEESQKWWNEDPYQERDPSRIDRQD